MKSGMQRMYSKRNPGPAPKTWTMKGKGCMDHGHRNYTKDRREGGPFGR